MAIDYGYGSMYAMVTVTVKASRWLWCIVVLPSGGRVDDGQMNSVLFHLSVWPSSAEPVDNGRVDDGQTHFVLFHLSVWPSNANLIRSAASSATAAHAARGGIQFINQPTTHYPTIITISAFGIPSKSVRRFIVIVAGDIIYYYHVIEASKRA